MLARRFTRETPAKDSHDFPRHDRAAFAAQRPADVSRSRTQSSPSTLTPTRRLNA